LFPESQFCDCESLFLLFSHQIPIKTYLTFTHQISLSYYSCLFGSIRAQPKIPNHISWSLSKRMRERTLILGTTNLKSKMEKYYSKKAKIVDRVIDEPDSDRTTQLPDALSVMQPQLPLTSKSHPCKSPSFDVNEISLQVDPGLRQKISSFHPDLQDQIRRAYLEKGACQPRGYSFPYKDMSGFNIKFNSAWFDAYHWLEYSVKEDAAYYLHCYLFKQEGSSKQEGGDSFTSNGFTHWNKSNRFHLHVGAINSSHNDCVRKCNALMKQAQNITAAFNKKDDQSKKDY
ncbi:hypothetical protein LINGRAHAP2_LOCUS22704, partial [Linum grandiflorum]